MRDLLVITPTRGRPTSATRLLNAIRATSTADTQLVLGVDDDDHSYDDADLDCWMYTGPRQNCAGWTNKIARTAGGDFRYLASFGDDHVPVTPGWDAALLAAIDDMGGTGIAYGDDGLQGANLPTAPVISSDIVAALGWMFYPPIVHVFADNVWLDLGREAGCLCYVPGVRIEHLHYTSGLSPHDQTYADRDPFWAQDEAAYCAWKQNEMAGDIDKVRKLREGR